MQSRGYAVVAQLVERHLAKVEVAGSNPVFRSIKIRNCLQKQSEHAQVVELVDTPDLKSCDQ